MKVLSLGEKIKFFRKRAKLSQLDLEIFINAASGSISRIENGKTNPTKETLFDIAKILKLNNIETAELFGISFANFQDEMYINIIAHKVYEILEQRIDR